jgi:hypothetical protein
MAERKQKRPAEAVSGLYGAIPTALLDSVAFMGASYPAKALLYDLIRQHNGSNNGRLQLSFAWLEKRGWNSRDTVQRARDELIARGLLVKTKQGGLNIGPSWYALTWLPISNFVGLDMQAKDYHRGAWAMMDKLPIAEKRQGHVIEWRGTKPIIRKPENANAVPPDGTGSTGKRASTVPAAGTVKRATVP